MNRLLVRRLLPALLVAAGLAWSCPARAECPDQFSYTVIAEDGDTVEGNTLSLGSPFSLLSVSEPSISVDGEVAFIAWDGEVALVVVGDGNSLRVVARGGTDPSTDMMPSEVLISAGGDVLFRAGVPAPNNLGVGFFRATAGDPSLIIDNVQDDDPSRYRTFGSWDVTDNGSVVVTATPQVAESGESLVISASSPGSSGTELFRETEGSLGMNVVSAASDSQVLLWVSDGSNSGFYTSLSNAIATWDESVDEEYGVFGAIEGNGMIAYSENYPRPDDPSRGGHRIWRASSGGRTLLADLETPGIVVSSGETFDIEPEIALVSFSGVAPTAPEAQRCVVASVTGETDRIVMIDEDGVTTVASTDTVFPGDLYAYNFELFRGSANGLGEVTFLAHVAAGTHRAIIRATPMSGGSTTDGGVSPGTDGGVSPGTDGGALDAGVDPTPDAGSDPDATGSADCAAGGTTSPALSLLLLGLALVRRRRAS